MPVVQKLRIMGLGSCLGPETSFALVLDGTPSQDDRNELLAVHTAPFLPLGRMWKTLNFFEPIFSSTKVRNSSTYLRLF